MIFRITVWIIVGSMMDMSGDSNLLFAGGQESPISDVSMPASVADSGTTLDQRRVFVIVSSDFLNVTFNN